MLCPKSILLAAAFIFSLNDLGVHSFPLKNIEPSEVDELPRPSFEWDVDEAMSSIKLNVDFHDGAAPDVAILNPRVYNGDEEPCILYGFLLNERKVEVAVNGCPSDDNFNVVMRSNRYPGGVFLVENGATREIGQNPQLIDVVLPAQYEELEVDDAENEPEESEDEVEQENDMETEIETFENEAVVASAEGGETANNAEVNEVEVQSENQDKDESKEEESEDEVTSEEGNDAGSDPEVNEEEALPEEGNDTENKVEEIEVADDNSDNTSEENSSEEINDVENGPEDNDDETIQEDGNDLESDSEETEDEVLTEEDAGTDNESEESENESLPKEDDQTVNAPEGNEGAVSPQEERSGRLSNDFEDIVDLYKK